MRAGRRHGQSRRHRHQGWLPHGDTSKMFFTGKPSVLAKRWSTSPRSSTKVSVKPGRARTWGISDHAIQTLAHTNRFSVIREFGGHGIGHRFPKNRRSCTTAGRGTASARTVRPRGQSVFVSGASCCQDFGTTSL